LRVAEPEAELHIADTVLQSGMTYQLSFSPQLLQNIDSATIVNQSELAKGEVNIELSGNDIYPLTIPINGEANLLLRTPTEITAMVVPRQQQQTDKIGRLIKTVQLIRKLLFQLMEHQS